MTMYFVKCKFKTDTRNAESLLSENSRLMSAEDCANCGCKKRQFMVGVVELPSTFPRRPVWTDELAEELHKPFKLKFPF